jgi:hypothetical protein
LTILFFYGIIFIEKYKGEEYMPTHASRDTTTGLKFEEKVKITHGDGWIDLHKDTLYTYLKKHGIDWTTLISRRLKPDEAFFNPTTQQFIIYEKKFQQTEGSADEKPQTCPFKIRQFKKIGKAIGAREDRVRYIYILSTWFKKPMYQDMLDFIKDVPGCDYIFEDELDNIDLNEKIAY